MNAIVGALVIVLVIVVMAGILSFFVLRGEKKMQSERDMALFAGKLENTDCSIKDVTKYLKRTNSFVEYSVNDR